MSNRLQEIQAYIMNPEFSAERGSIILSAAHHACGIDLHKYASPSEMPEEISAQMFGLINRSFQKVAEAETETGTKYPDDALVNATLRALESLAKREMPKEFYQETGTYRQ